MATLCGYAMITANNVRRIGRTTNCALAQISGNISAVRISHDDIARHGCVAKGARLLRDCRQRRYLHGWRRLSPTIRRQSDRGANGEGRARGIRCGAGAWAQVEPFALKVLFTWLPPAFAIYYWRRFFASKMGDYVFGRHARAASREMHELANDCRSLLEKSRIEAPALYPLYRAIDAYVT
jgi:hypothetical protein